jgi:2-polyprenyl-3-methyl-5-hydroxy-6-metoxy-1,4-benzoquinol methylase
VSHVDDFAVHHMSNKYVNTVGIGAVEFKRQLDTLLTIDQGAGSAGSLIGTDTTLPNAQYSKDYYGASSAEVLSAVPPSAKRVLSVGYGFGKNELVLAGQGIDVTVIPIDAVCAAQASANGLRVIEGDLDDACARLGSEKFDCVLYLNVLHLVDDPCRVISQFRSACAPGAVIVVQSPNMRSAQTIRWSLRNRSCRNFSPFSETRTHPTSVGMVKRWCRAAGYKVERAVGVNSSSIGGYRGSAGSVVDLLMAPEFVATARIRPRHDDAAISAAG